MEYSGGGSKGNNMHEFGPMAARSEMINIQLEEANVSNLQSRINCLGFVSVTVLHQIHFSGRPFHVPSCRLSSQLECPCLFALTTASARLLERPTSQFLHGDAHIGDFVAACGVLAPRLNASFLVQGVPRGRIATSQLPVCHLLPWD